MEEGKPEEVLCELLEKGGKLGKGGYTRWSVQSWGVKTRRLALEELREK